MLPTINFQYQSCFQTYKINDVISEWMLSAKFVSRNLFQAQMLPELFSASVISRRRLRTCCFVVALIRVVSLMKFNPHPNPPPDETTSHWTRLAKGYA